MTTTTNAGSDNGAELGAILTRADAAMGGGDGKAALLALGEALVASGDGDGVHPIVTRIVDVHKKTPGEVETAVSLLARAEERFGARREIVEARASIHESAGHHEAAFAMLQRLAT